MPPFTNHVGEVDAEAEARWQSLYRLGDERLGQFLGFVGTVSPETRFIVYSRGTDKRWQADYYREVEWKELLEARYPSLKGRVSTILIPRDKKGTFRDEKTAHDIRKLVQDSLNASKKRS